MNKLQFRTGSTMLIVSGAIAMGQGTEHKSTPIDQELMSQIVSDIADAISENYVFPEVGKHVCATLKANLEDGDYDHLDRDGLANRLRQELIGLTNDKHFSIRALPQGWEPPTEDQGSRPERGPRAPYGFDRVERLAGNIGYIDLRGFQPAPYIAETTESVMHLMQDSNAVIFDLRNNGGGDPAAVQLISSYLFDPSEPVHLNSLYSRPNDQTTEYWTHDDINTIYAIPETPVYILTSNRTFSAAEEFSYNLQNLDRATIIGETTGGGAHPVQSHFVHNELIATIPFARAINPISGTNWEGTGVKPDIEIDASKALEFTVSTILESAYENGDESVRWGLAHSRAKSNPIELSISDKEHYEGSYSDRKIRIGDNGLEYKREGVGDWRAIICSSSDVFIIPDLKGFLIEFERDDEHQIIGIRGHYQGRGSDFSPKN